MGVACVHVCEMSMAYAHICICDECGIRAYVCVVDVACVHVCA